MSDNTELTLIVEAVKSRDSSNMRGVLFQCKKKNLSITPMLSTLDVYGYSPIHYAVCQENLDILDQLLAHADEQCVNAVSGISLTPLLLLLFMNFSSAAEDMLVSLLEANADPNLLLRPLAGYWCGRDVIAHANLPLVFALQTERWRMAEILLVGGANPRSANCLCRAIDFTLEHPRLFRYLLDRGCCHEDLLSLVLTQDFEGRCEQAVFDLCYAMLPYYNDCQYSDFGVLCTAATSGYFEVVVLLLTSLRPGSHSPHISLVPATLGKMLRLLTLQNYRRFLAAYFQFLEVHLFTGAPYLYLLYTARNVDFLKILLEEAVRRDPELRRWRASSKHMHDPMNINNNRWLINGTELHLWTDVDMEAHVFTMDKLDMLGDYEPFDFMSAVVYHISSWEAMALIVPTLLQYEIKFSPMAVATFMLRAVKECRVPQHELLSAVQQLSTNCCEEKGCCWFRKHLFLKLCSSLLQTSYHSTNVKILITLLRLGVDVADVFNQFIITPYLNEYTVAILKHFEPRPVECWMFPPRALKAPNTCERREPASLMALSRHAVRSSLGFCRVREKLERSGLSLPTSIINYISFQDPVTSASYDELDADLNSSDLSVG